MRNVPVSEAKAHLTQLLDEVERGETIVVTRHGRPVARIVPESQSRAEEKRWAVESIRALRQRVGKAAFEEISAARHEGHKY